METSDKSESKIKEKLNLHVKKRLQESSKQPSHDNTSNSKDIASVSVGPRAKRQKTKNATKSTPIIKDLAKGNELLLSPGATNSNDTTNSSINSTDQDAELNDRETVDRIATTDKPAKAGQRVDIFSWILNQKKSSLMRDPEVVACLNALSERKN
ncbi:uncharacterized protein LOC131212832 [Anopheles bellator]|uniref:uncharacterized protein LOC131212832 n=1 Tax=Anopheles bellator TaxID=139047 RepID=UPI002649DF18|nr:uncharacterized protein LOC131212832 [Anopheles bellator]